MRKKVGLVVLTLLVGLAAYGSWFAYGELEALKRPRYEAGEHKGTLFCARCHPRMHADWSARSLHAAATTGDSFQAYLRKFRENFLLNAVVGDAVCFACHGREGSDEGVSCEICHGSVIPDTSIEETHKRKYKPGLDDLRKPEFCAKCHELRSPLSGDSLMSVYSEWRASPAGHGGVTCQDCHMGPRKGPLSYHGFDTALRDVQIYRDELEITNVALEYHQLTLTITNHVMGHAIPASGGTRMLALEVRLLDTESREIHRIVHTFGKQFALMPLSGLFPNRLTENTQLQSGEARYLKFELPSSLRDQIAAAKLTLRFYSVSDEHQGDLRHAHWVSEPILKQAFRL